MVYKMEFPEDVLAIIRSYAKPRFKYFREYNKTLRILGKAVWPRLKEKLESDPAIVLQSLLAYQTAVLRNRNLYQEMRTLGNNYELSWKEQNRFYNMNFYAKKDVDDSFCVLIRLLHPEQNTYWALDGI